MIVTKLRGGHSQLIGYARVSRREQNLDSQIDALTRAGCCRIYQEKVSGTAQHRPALVAMLDTLRKGDTVVVAALDRLGRKLSELIRTLESLREQGCHFHDLRHGINTNSQHGKLVLHLLMVLAESERELIAERTREGIASAALRGRIAGRPTVLTPAKIEQVMHLRGKGYSMRQIAVACSLGQATVRKAIDMREPSDPRQQRIEGT